MVRSIIWNTFEIDLFENLTGVSSHRMLILSKRGLFHRIDFNFPVARATQTWHCLRDEYSPKCTVKTSQRYAFGQ